MKRCVRMLYVSTISFCIIALIGGCVGQNTSSRLTVADLPLMPRYVRPYVPPSKNVLPTDQPYYITGMRLDGEIGLATELGGVYWIAPTHPISATMLFTNGTPWTRDLRVLCLIDYRQAPCLLQTEVLSAKSLPGRQEEIHLQFPGFAQGVHVVDVVALSYVPLPRQITEEAEQLTESIVRSNDFFWHAHVTVYAGSYTIPSLPYQPLQTGMANSNSSGSLGMSVTTISDTTIQLLPHPNLAQIDNPHGQLIQVSPGQQLTFYLISKHGEDASYYQLAKQFDLEAETTALPVVITAFIDTQQIPLNTTLPGGPVFSKIPHGKEIVVPISFKAPTKPGLYSYFVLYQEGPFIKRGNMIPQTDGGMIYQSFPDVMFLNTTDRVIFEVTS